MFKINILKIININYVVFLYTLDLHNLAIITPI
jgi:hypothetical protein